MRRIFAFVALLSIVVSGAGPTFSVRLNAQAKYLIWDGTYTTAQAERGRVAHGTHCVACHGNDDRGGKAAALSGDVFMLHWETKTVEGFFHKIRDTMPKRGTASDLHTISDRDKLDVVAYLLQRNGFPAGNRELTDDAAVLGKLEIIPQDGPSPPRNGSMVQATGCLERREDRWFLTSSTEPQLTTFGPMSAADREAAKTAPLGQGAVQLISVFPSPAPYVGHRLRATGLLVANPASNQINVLSIEVLAATCAP